MSEITLINAVKNLKAVYHLTEYQNKKLESYFSAVLIGDYIYPGVLKSKTGIDIKIIYEIMEELKKQNFVNNIYEIYCSNCYRSKGRFLESLREFKEDFYCDFCDEKLNIAEDIIVLYKVVKI